MPDGGARSTRTTGGAIGRAWAVEPGEAAGIRPPSDPGGGASAATIAGGAAEPRASDRPRLRRQAAQRANRPPGARAQAHGDPRPDPYSIEGGGVGAGMPAGTAAPPPVDAVAAVPASSRATAVAAAGQGVSASRYGGRGRDASGNAGGTARPDAGAEGVSCAPALVRCSAGAAAAVGLGRRRRCSRATVSRSARPVSAKPSSRWKRRSAIRDWRPQRPSGAPGSKPSAFRSAWMDRASVVATCWANAWTGGTAPAKATPIRSVHRGSVRILFATRGPLHAGVLRLPVLLRRPASTVFQVDLPNQGRSHRLTELTSAACRMDRRAPSWAACGDSVSLQAASRLTASSRASSATPPPRCRCASMRATIPATAASVAPTSTIVMERKVSRSALRVAAVTDEATQACCRSRRRVSKASRTFGATAGRAATASGGRAPQASPRRRAPSSCVAFARASRTRAYLSAPRQDADRPRCAQGSHGGSQGAACRLAGAGDAARVRGGRLASERRWAAVGACVARVSPRWLTPAGRTWSFRPRQ
ncbi:hypothetical protein SAMN05192568_100432 [Methylobacterium pseudosasicola]|uniref:Uncharacterized protein n=1 Tax=Methylobacterium pseudosasicola TaxID=582667 RepID=A0A1I4H4U4_9HYPH|nr:hypothetical protein SAMN05192568_100432 [Methylobacterium pseudosasicola]